MDSGRLGRVLGAGARHAAKTMVEAVDAATSDDPKPQRPSPQVIRPGATSAASTAARQTVTRQQVARAAATGAKAAGRGFFGSLKHASRALWLEVTGTFFALFSLSIGYGAWQRRHDWHTTGHLQQKFWAECLIAAMFLWFSVSNFLRAGKRSR